MQNQINKFKLINDTQEQREMLEELFSQNLEDENNINMIWQPCIILIIRYSKQLFLLVTSFFFQIQQVINYHLHYAFSVYYNKPLYIQR